jgi:hypothetical protein
LEDNKIEKPLANLTEGGRKRLKLIKLQIPEPDGFTARFCQTFNE